MGDTATPCAACGLCCDGTLFDRARTSPEEAPRIRAYGLDVHSDEQHFALPCALLDGTACTIYSDRFHVCRTFRCMVLRRLEGGEHDRARADALIAEAKRLRAVAESHVAGAGNTQCRHSELLALSDWSSRPDAADRRVAAQTFLGLSALERFVTAHFRLPRKSPLAHSGDPGEARAKGPA